jgi:hydroxyethylthiazole kinase-like uncharacterized protein yjeF
MTLSGKALLLSQQIRLLEQQAADANLMQKAGTAVAALARELLQGDNGPIMVVAGHGNNGGDALVAALQLKTSRHRVIVVLVAEADALPNEAAEALAKWIASGGSVQSEIPSDMRFSVVIDGLFGIGLQRPLQENHAALVQQINALDCPVLAIDIPSGLHADSGRVLGSAVKATHTLTLLARKPGLYTLDGPDHVGMVHFDDLGMNDSGTPSSGSLITTDTLPIVPRRRLNSHKGLFGDVAVLGGSAGMSGAVLLAARAALYCGSGRVYGGFLAEPPMLDTQQPELMLRHASAIAELGKLSCVIIGPGLGQSQTAVELLGLWLGQKIPLLLDADALNLLAVKPHLQQALQRRQSATVITPHPLEAARLLACSSAEIQGDRITAALRLAQTFNAVCVLKGVGSICATLDGGWHINTSGNPGLASAGTGDVLAGIIGSLLGQGFSAIDAARLGTYVHGAAADALVKEGMGPVGLTASELIPTVRHLINQYSQDD